MQPKTTIQTAWAAKAQDFFSKINDLNSGYAVLSQGGWADRGQLLAYRAESLPEMQVAFVPPGQPAKDLSQLSWRSVPAVDWTEKLQMVCGGTPKTRKGLDHLVYECIHWKRADGSGITMADQKFYDSPTPKQDYPKEFTKINQLFASFEKPYKPVAPKNAPVTKKEQ